MLEKMMMLLGATKSILPYAVEYAKYILYAAPVMMASFVLNNLLRAEGKTKLAMTGIGIGGILNIALDPLLIFGFGMDIGGAAVATLISQVIGFIVLLSFFRKKTILRFSIRKISKKFTIYKEFIGNGMPSLFRQGLASAASVALNRVAAAQSDAAVAAMSIVGKIFMMVFCVLIGFGQGYQPAAGYNYGAKEYGRMKTAVFTALLSFLGISLVLGIAGLILGKQIMIWLNTPADCLDMASEYLRIYFLGLPFLFMYNVLSAMFNALGKSRIPLYFLIFSSIFNVILDIIMVTKMDMGVAGVAWATLIAQGISAVLSFGVLLKNLKGLEGKQKTLFDKMELAEMTRIAIPSILQQSTVSIGMMLVQSVVNGFGSEALAGFSAAMRIESICVVPMSAIGNAVSSFTAQNIGAERKDRVVMGLHAASKMVIVCSVVICFFLEVFSHSMIMLFLGNEGTQIALFTGIGYLTFMGWFFCFIGFKMAVDGLLRGAGDMKMFTVANLVNLGIRVIIAVTCAPRFGIAMVWYAVPVGWFANWIISYAEYRTGKWKTL